MTRDPKAKLRLFLCHSSADKATVRSLYRRLRDSGIDPWLDEENLLPGQEWELEITKAVRASDAVLVCLSETSVSKDGFVNREIKYALDIADTKPEGTVFIIPCKIEPCAVPGRLDRWHWVNLYEEGGYENLLRSLRARERQAFRARKTGQEPQERQADGTQPEQIRQTHEAAPTSEAPRELLPEISTANTAKDERALPQRNEQVAVDKTSKGVSILLRGVLVFSVTTLGLAFVLEGWHLLTFGRVIGIWSTCLELISWWPYQFLVSLVVFIRLVVALTGWPHRFGEVLRRWRH